MRSLLVVAALVAGLSSCCQAVETAPTSSCVRASDPIAAGRPFTITASIVTGGGGSVTCSTVVDGGSIALTLTGTACSNAAGRDIGVPSSASCDVPALPEGVYDLPGQATLTLFDGGFSVDGGFSIADGRTCF